MAKVWQPKKVVNCAMCYGKHSHPYKIINLGIWWEDDIPYIKYDFCSICYTILNKLWANDTKLKPHKSNQIYVESDVVYHTEYLYNLIKNNYIKYNAFVNARSNYIKYITYPSIVYELYYTNTSILYKVPQDIIDYILYIFKQL
jgi:hypothetical protein